MSSKIMAEKRRKEEMLKQNRESEEVQGKYENKGGSWEQGSRESKGYLGYC